MSEKKTRSPRSAKTWPFSRPFLFSSSFSYRKNPPNSSTIFRRTQNRINYLMSVRLSCAPSCECPTHDTTVQQLNWLELWSHCMICALLSLIGVPRCDSLLSFHVGETFYFFILSCKYYLSISLRNRQFCLIVRTHQLHQFEFLSAFLALRIQEIH